MVALSDPELLTCIRAGDARAEEAELSRRYLDRIRLYGRKHLREASVVADFVQDVMLAVLEAARAGRIIDPERFGHYVLGACRNMCWSMHRRQTRRAAIEGGEERDQAVGGELGMMPHERERLEGCLDKLPVRDRKVVYMSFHEDRTAEAIGDALGMTNSNVRVVRHRALVRLRECIDGGPS